MPRRMLPVAPEIPSISFNYAFLGGYPKFTVGIYDHFFKFLISLVAIYRLLRFFHLGD